MVLRRTLVFSLALCLSSGAVCGPHALGQDDGSKRGRKYKAPPDVSHIEVTVIKGYNKKPIPNAAVVFNSTKDGKNEGNLEVKTDPDGKAVIDVIPTGSTVTVQVIADGFATFAQDYDVKDASKSILVTMIRPRAQISTYVDNAGKAADRKPGVQEPAKPSTPPAATNPNGSSSPTSSSKSSPTTTQAPTSK